MKIFFKLLLLFTMTTPVFAQLDFKTEQLKFERVRTAYDQKWANLQKDLKAKNVTGPFALYLVAFKSEGKLEVWLKTDQQKTYNLFKTFDFCAHSGVPGPKIKEGDLQTPEGFYFINVFNPVSNFYLSLGINYPNAVDQLRSGKDKPGGDIYIHGNCVTLGCIPLTDDKIKELYVLAVEARHSGQIKIPVHIYPFKMTSGNLNSFLPQYPRQKALWTNLATGYNYFEKKRTIPQVGEQNGRYLFK